MSERWSDKFDARVRQWCDKVAPLAVDALVRAVLVAGDQSERACEVVAEELYVRLALLDYPPQPHATDSSGEI
jgi:hypothetical protein